MARTSIIGPSSVVIGDVSGKGDLEIGGRIQGDVDVIGLVQVNEGGVVLGSIRARDVRVSGRVEGSILAHAGLSLLAGAHVSGDLQAARLGIEEGARVRGNVRTDTPDADREEEPAPLSEAAASEPAFEEEAEGRHDRRRRDRRRKRSGGPPPVAPSAPSPAAPSRNAQPGSSTALRTDAARPVPAAGPRPAPVREAPRAERAGPPAPVVPALAKGARGHRRPSKDHF